jgi:predicted NAD/FAD-binding protein
MTRLQSLPPGPRFFVTLNAEDRINPRCVLRRMVYHHPVFTAGRAAAQSRHRELIDHHGISYCGAYWGNGFHEDGVNSGLAVAEALNAVPARAGRERLALQEAAY